MQNSFFFRRHGDLRRDRSFRLLFELGAKDKQGDHLLFNTSKEFSSFNDGYSKRRFTGRRMIKNHLYYHVKYKLYCYCLVTADQKIHFPIVNSKIFLLNQLSIIFHNIFLAFSDNLTIQNDSISFIFPTVSSEGALSRCSVIWHPFLEI